MPHPELWVLGVHDGHNCGATLVCGGRVVASVSEERLSRKKNEVGYPRRSIEAVLQIGGIDSSQLASIVYASLFMHRTEYLTDITPWYKVGARDQERAKQESPAYQKAVFEQRKAERIAEICQHLDVGPERVSFLEHHLCHLAAAYYTRPAASSDRGILGLTCDGAGDNLCATVAVCRGNDIKRIAATGRSASLGKIYSRITFLMGMTPWEHEYKVMGLAPYAEPDRSERAAEPLRKLLHINRDKLVFELGGELSTNYCYEYLRDAFEGVRFDIIAGAAQHFAEEMMCQWIDAAIAQTGIGDIVCGGGVFMNVKANMLIAGLPAVRSMYVMPSAADESLAIGAALHDYYQRTGVTDHAPSVLPNLYLGAENTRASEERAARTLQKDSAFAVSEPGDMESEIADMLAAGEVVARCSGRMEWGARALGNRSILCSAHDSRLVDRINQAVKKRDFWMPFAPSIREEEANRYFNDPKGMRPKFMTFAYQTRPETYSDIAAASHPRDGTIRPQVVSAGSNPKYHRILSRFHDRTGRGALLNTSFNLHGYPIVNTPEDAIGVLTNSGLETLALGHLLIRKSRPSSH